VTDSAISSKRWAILALVVVAQFMVILDVAIVNVALPAIGSDLGFSQQSLQWVITAYAIVFGGALLLGGRLADLLGRRRIFLSGLALFTASSLLSGLAWSEGSLIVFRAVQGLGGALLAPAGLSILMTTFREGRERNVALGIWGAASGSGAAVGVLLGGLLTSYLSWSWIFFINVPVGIGAIWATRWLLEAAPGNVVGRRHFDLAGAASVTSGLMLFVYALTRATDVGWTSRETIALLSASVLLIAAFVGIELRSRSPLLPMRMFRLRTLTTANLIVVVVASIAFSWFFLQTLYLQQVLGYSALEAGFAFLATAGTTMPAALIAQGLVTRIGVKPVMTIGLALMAIAYLWYTQLPTDGSFWTHLFVPYVISGFGLPFSFIPVSLAALANLEERIAGVASGLLNTSQQIGGALGVAIAATISTEHSRTLLAEGAQRAEALTGGFNWAFWVGVVFSLVGVAVSAFVLRRDDVPTAAAETTAAPA
jgi:EmrB/QacA subfamily drug resistance transporter